MGVFFKVNSRPLPAQISRSQSAAVVERTTPVKPARSGSASGCSQRSTASYPDPRRNPGPFLFAPAAAWVTGALGASASAAAAEALIRITLAAYRTDAFVHVSAGECCCAKFSLAVVNRTPG